VPFSFDFLNALGKNLEIHLDALDFKKNTTLIECFDNIMIIIKGTYNLLCKIIMVSKNN